MCIRDRVVAEDVDATTLGHPGAQRASGALVLIPDRDPDGHWACKGCSWICTAASWLALLGICWAPGQDGGERPRRHELDRDAIERLRETAHGAVGGHDYDPVSYTHLRAHE